LSVQLHVTFRIQILLETNFITLKIVMLQCKDDS